MTAAIHRRPNYAHEAMVLAERRRRDAVDPLWRERLPRLQPRDRWIEGHMPARPSLLARLFSGVR